MRITAVQVPAEEEDETRAACQEKQRMEVGTMRS